jgi:hypothetical protein
MEHFILLIVSVCISVWFFYKYKESQVKLKSFISKNLSLKLENNSMKSKMKYLETYKDDVSKTFKILDDELLLIKDNLTQQPRQQNTTRQNTQSVPQVIPRQNIQSIPRHRVALLTPDLLTSLMTNEVPSQQSQSQQSQPVPQSQDVFNNIFNRFLTSNISSNDIELLRHQENSSQQTPQQQTPQQETYQETYQETHQSQTEPIERQLETIPEEREEREEQKILFSPNNYTKYLIGQEPNQNQD